MGGRGTSGATLTAAARDYTPYQHGQITRKEAGTIYRAIKDGHLTAKPELTRELYDATNSNLRFAGERYNHDYLYYDRIYDATRAILNNDYKKAQKLVRYVEEDRIRRSSKKSIWYKYKK